jgi:hypothetical protein
MSKNKYAKEGGTTTTETGEGKQRDHTKSGKKAQRKELRRLEAIVRQAERIEKAEKNAQRAKDKAEAQRKIDKAKLTLQQIRGGTPHTDLQTKVKTVAAEPVTTVK